ncbi:hypothetical protein [Paludisphaera soli]|uniref:hypothetical protein n=1 Tax=Paludisphaera soli TaxID=2712865 RepID=UPI0013ED8B8F|nr:hypothetical protein [Paludisphaera soli]
MSRRLPYKIAGTAPKTIEFVRNDLTISTSRVLLDEVRVVGRSLRVADPAWVDEVAELRINIEDGLYPVYAYEWSHRLGPITACVIIPFVRPRWTTTCRLRIFNDIRPDLTKGLIVDSGEIAIASGNQIVLRSGLGDGYYPVFENRNFGVRTQSVVIDFKLYESSNYGVGHGFVLDEYGIPIT